MEKNIQNVAPSMKPSETPQGQPYSYESLDSYINNMYQSSSATVALLYEAAETGGPSSRLTFALLARQMKVNGALDSLNDAAQNTVSYPQRSASA